MTVVARPSTPARLFPVLISALLIAAAGCQPPEVQVAQPPLPQGGMTIYQLASLLGMRVSASTGYTAMLENPSNRLLIFGPPQPSMMLNGRPVDIGRGILSNGEYLIVPRDLAGNLRPQLRQPYRPPPEAVAHANHAPVSIGATDSLPRPAKTPRATGKIIVVDPGHGGDDPGALNRSHRTGGPHEKDINLHTALCLRDALRAYGHTVIMTRETDATVDLHDRAPVANRNKADLFVSIHADSAANKAAEGFSVYVARQASRQSTQLGQAIVSSLQAARVTSRGLKQADYVVLVETRCPAVLVEQGFMTNASEMARLATPSYRRDLASAIAAGIDQALRSR